MSLLRSFIANWYRGYKHAAPLELGIVVLALLAVALLPGCSDSTGQKHEVVFPVQSKIFSHVEIIGSRGTAPGQFNKPRSLALDKDDNLFVVDMTGRVQKFSSNGVYLLSWQMPETDLGKAKGMSCDRDGNIVVVEPHYQRVNHFSTDGKLMAQWGKKGTNAGELVLPRAVAVNSRGENIVSEYTTVDRVQIFSADGQRGLHIFGKTGAEDGALNRPEGLGVDAQDRIYVADSCNHRIQIFSPEGKFLKSYGKPGSQLGEVSYPYDVRVDAAGWQYVCEFGNSRIQIFDVNQQPMEILGQAGGAPGELANPWSIALDSKGNLYVADSQNHRVQKFVRSQKSEVRSQNLGEEIVAVARLGRSRSASHFSKVENGHECRAGFPACRFAALFSAVLDRKYSAMNCLSGTGDWKVARTGRLESLPSVLVCASHSK